MPKFFINRPIFAWVIAIFIIIAGLVSITLLPVEQFPNVTSPTITVRVTYPGSSPETIDENILSLMEREMSGIDGLRYTSTQASTGSGVLRAIFNSGVDEKFAQVEIQNRLAKIEPKLPAIVKQYGLNVSRSNSNTLMFVALVSNNPNINTTDLGDYTNRNILPEIQRLDGVGETQLFGTEKAMRIWLDPTKMRSLGLSTSQISTAISGQNLDISGGSIGTPPISNTLLSTVQLTIPGSLSSAEEFLNIILKSDSNGSIVRLREVANAEIGQESYAFNSIANGQPNVAFMVSLSNTGNALSTSKAVQNKMEELKRYFPEGVEYFVPYDTSTFVSFSIQKVITTLLEAYFLVFLVMLLFLQKIRYTFIPTIVVPISLLGTLAVLYALGMSINILTMFAMILVIGIIVDDAIVVVENVERIMSEEGLSPKEATLKAMRQISGAVVGITLILISVFIPLAFFSGATGNIYRQFAAVMSVSIAFSGFLALTLTPALCATILKPIDHHAENKNHSVFQRFLNWFASFFGKFTNKYLNLLAKIIRISVVMVILFLVILAAIYPVYKQLPTSFLPEEDQGVLIVSVQLPNDASFNRTNEVIAQINGYLSKQPEVKNVMNILGFGFAGTGQNVALNFITLKDWNQRNNKGSSASELKNRMQNFVVGIRDAFIFVVQPPSIPALGMSNDMELILQDRNGLGYQALSQAAAQLVGLAYQSEELAGTRRDGLGDTEKLKINIDREAMAVNNVSLSGLSQVLSTYLTGGYISDFSNNGRLQQVILQADVDYREDIGNLLNFTVQNNLGLDVPLTAFATTEWVSSPVVLTRYNGYPSLSIKTNPAPGFSSGDVIIEIEKIMAQLPQGFGSEWTGITLDEQQAGAESMILYIFSILAVFLCLAALYESWSLPFSVIMVIPLGVIGILFGVWITGKPNDIYFQIGVITVIGLSAKNAILIIEFAKDLMEEGNSLLKSALKAASLRFRPIIMTSVAFILGVAPLMIATGASSASQREIGTGVFFGMLVGTTFSVFFVPLFFIWIQTIFNKNGKNKKTERLSDIESKK